MPSDNEAERKIYFYRARDADDDPDFELDVSDICSAIGSLKGTPDFYLDEGADKITCAEVVSSRQPPKIKLYAIRRENLPSRDNGSGDILELGLAEEEGLAEAIHIRLYPNNVIAAEFFYYGPRVSRLQTFLNARCDQNIVIRPLLRGDVIERALQFGDIRALRLKMHPSDLSRAKASTLGLSGAIKTAKDFDAQVYADLTLRSDRHDASFTAKVKALLRLLRNEEPTELFANLEVEGTHSDTRTVESLNLLSDHLVRVAHIPREHARTRALDSDAAFRAIHQAYNDVKDDLPSDAVAD